MKLLNNAEQKVMDFINSNFYESGIKVTSFKGLPGGKIITDKNDKKMLIYYDLLKEKIVTEIK